ncbi:RNA polymerase recycling motor HelD [Lacticaseibacillus pabuli]|uniref:RNA polymerase recycling motor HelD n=1 Tax=Lacticaseibacillus pabuli TaxID=3025672 RepID=A0ABY7WUR0_9LACO|nr:RNA polymerase recycling motor HelD [Lacticaseibacillus sp. KACC 23028]WDF83198.1 RNA polymerase recycling motor HelD [Lacticaseibacillus sp. KACC 23028]
MTEDQHAYEQKHLDDIITKLGSAEKRLSKDIVRTKAEAKNINENFFNDFSLNFSNDAESLETAASIQEQQQMLDERRMVERQSQNQLVTVKRLLHSPYFARIDFQEKGEKPETVYIGLGSFSDENGHFLIYDWRAPISSIYYDGGLGKVSYQTPDGTQEATVSLKRQFVLKNGRIETMFDTTETIGDQMLLEVLGEKSDTQMKSIVTTIQREQNQIIRDTDAQLLFVQGAAGSGKTSAVLQRVAYLLYRYRGNLTSSQVIMFSPNQLFSDYIGNVLPELGEQNMVQFTYYQYVTRRMPGMQVQNLFQQFEQQLTDRQQKVEQVKESRAFFKATKAYAKSLESAGVRFRDVKFKGEKFFAKKRIEDIFYSYNENYHMGNRLNATKDRLINMLNRRVKSEMKSQWVQDAVQGLSEEDIRALQSEGPQEFKDSDSEYDFFARKIVLDSFKEIETAVAHNHFLNVRGQYVSFLRTVPELMDLKKFGLTAADWEAETDQFVEDFRARKLSMADATPYMYLYDLMIGRHGDRKMRFVFIDEIQDYTPYQLAYLKASFPKAKFTLLGDLNQAIFTGANARGLMTETAKMFPAEKTRVIQLTQSYRSTAEVTDFTKAILKSGQTIVAFNRQGPKPTIAMRKTEQELLDQTIKQLAVNDKAGQTTAIIAKSLEEAEALWQQLKDAGQETTLIRSENQRLVPGVIIVPSFLAKGLEFDAVIVWRANKANFGDDRERELLYTICSRAMHRLSIMVDGELSPLLAQVPQDLYEEV